MRRPIDQATAAQAFSRPGADTRQWLSIGLVHAGDPADVVVFDEEYGAPLVSVVLQPSDVPIMCRVSASLAGNGEGEWHPFIQNDEVVVGVLEGDEKAGGIILGRLNNGLDKFPASVAGQDATKNAFGFRRRRTPFMEEFAGPILLRSAPSGAFLSIDDIGTVTLRDGAGDALQLTADGFGYQSQDTTAVMQLNPGTGQFLLQIGDAYLQLSASDADQEVNTLLVPGPFVLGVSGDAPAEHVATIEGTLNLIAEIFNVLGAALTLTGGTPLTGASLGALLVSPAFSTTTITPALAVAAVSALDPTILPALFVALQATPQKQAAPAGQARPGLGSRGLLTG